ncbi:DUF4240 domain-containing protein [Actinomadura litoris]|uniref:DUF4240 domain-containing protein n=1 Tax=Actinomadura litoris TaxID=2678616 RepID=A0A7K1KZH1_9ACTN|nr:DUF4240 domain-containing protein [Actinomadura litoris]MUN37592.1 DUF4240 domain-containing protein [Actinomadura litoris]
MNDETRLWEMLEAAWAPLGPEVGQARRALARRTPEPGEDLYGKPPLSLVENALKAFLDNLAELSRDLSSEELTGLDRAVERLLFDIDRAEIHAVTDGSDDGFLYARGFIVALGREFYTAVNRDPRVAILDAECERLCYFFFHAHNERFGDFPDTGSGISRETCSNREGWPT